MAEHRDHQQPVPPDQENPLRDPEGAIQDTGSGGGAVPQHPVLFPIQTDAHAAELTQAARCYLSSSPGPDAGRAAQIAHYYEMPHDFGRYMIWATRELYISLYAHPVAVAKWKAYAYSIDNAREANEWDYLTVCAYNSGDPEKLAKIFLVRPGDDLRDIIRDITQFPDQIPPDHKMYSVAPDPWLLLL